MEFTYMQGNEDLFPNYYLSSPSEQYNYRHMSQADGAHYRPDELQNLGWATQQVGLDLRALQARELQVQNSKLVDRTIWLEEERERLSLDKDRLMALLANDLSVRSQG